MVHEITCKKCGKKEMRVGLNIGPFSCRCRSCYISFRKQQEKEAFEKYISGAKREPESLLYKEDE
jgi:hypothetical protein